MRNRLRVLAFDLLAPIAAVVALVYIGIALAWPVWWVAVCSVLCLLVLEGVIVNFALARRDSVTVGTDDDGPGLPVADRARVLERGRRLDESVAGSGLGLSIVADLVALHDGSLDLAKSPSGGLRVTISLPAARS